MTTSILSVLYRRGRVVQILWMVGFAVGICSHVVDLLVGGAGVYQGYPALVRVFWISLVVLDPLVVVTIGLRRVAGTVLGQW